MADTIADPSAVSADYKAMSPTWRRVADVMAGQDVMRAGGRKYLPQFPKETDDDYEYRRKNAKFTNIFADIIGDLAAKPFSKEVGVEEGAPPAIVSMQEDIDRRGNHIHTFAFEVFRNAIADGIDWILVDHTMLPQGATLADERAIGGGPYWVRVSALSLLAVYSAWVEGREQIIHARIAETRTEWRDGEEVEVESIRVLTRDRTKTGYAPARFELYERAKAGWLKVGEGPISLGVIPLVPLIIGHREGSTWRVRPPMLDALDLQVEHYQQETNLKNAKECTAFPIFVGNGVTPPDDGTKMAFGPRSVLFAPMNDQGMHGSWSVIEPGASSLTFLSLEIDKIAEAMRELGRQPLVQGTSGMTQSTALLASQKASSTAQAWASLLKDALEQAMVYTAQWLGVEPPSVFVDTDFAIDPGADQAPALLLQANQAGKLSDQTMRSEWKRRGVLSPEFDEDKEMELILAELPGDEEISAALTPKAAPVK